MPRIPWATRGLQWLGQWVPTPKGGGNLLNLVVVRIEGMRSNRVSQSRGEYVPAPCTHRPSHHPKRAGMRLWSLVVFESRFFEEGEVVTR